MNVPETIIVDELALVDSIEDEIADDWQARAAMIAVAEVERERDSVKQYKSDVAARCDAKINALEERARFLRESLLDFVRRHGKASFPDVGTAYSTRTKRKIVVTDPAAVKAEFGAVFVKDPTFDETAFRAWALDRFETTGEIPAGCDVVPEGETLAIRRS